MKRRILHSLSFLVLFVGIGGLWFAHEKYVKSAAAKYQELECSGCPHEIGDPVDSFNGVTVYYNGRISNVVGRNLTADNYNLGLKYQCVEFVKRYYYEFYKHKMPDTWGHAVDFFDPLLEDGQRNTRRDLIQYRNPSSSQPKVGDLIVFDGSYAEGFGHVAIITEVTEKKIEIIQQNPGAFGNSRATYPLMHQDGAWHISMGILGWLRKE